MLTNIQSHENLRDQLCQDLENVVLSYENKIGYSDVLIALSLYLKYQICGNADTFQEAQDTLSRLINFNLEKLFLEIKSEQSLKCNQH